MPYDVEPALATIVMTPLITLIETFRSEGIDASILDSSKISISGSRFVDDKGLARLDLSVYERMPDGMLVVQGRMMGHSYTPHK